MAKLREMGIGGVATVRSAYLESSGELGVIRNDDTVTLNKGSKLPGNR